MPAPTGQTTTITYGTTFDGSTIRTACDTTNHFRNIVGFTGTADYDCALIIDGLSSVSISGSPVHHFYAVISPIYGQADVKIKANSTIGNSVLSFQNVQSIIDVTGTSNGLSKRLQARANTSSGASVDPADNLIPDMALRTAKVVCKRIIVGTTVTVDGTACDLSIPQPPG
jgi:hypothetical protein